MHRGSSSVDGLGLRVLRCRVPEAPFLWLSLNAETAETPLMASHGGCRQRPHSLAGQHRSHRPGIAEKGVIGRVRLHVLEHRRSCAGPDGLGERPGRSPRHHSCNPFVVATLQTMYTLKKFICLIDTGSPAVNYGVLNHLSLGQDKMWDALIMMLAILKTYSEGLGNP